MQTVKMSENYSEHLNITIKPVSLIKSIIEHEATFENNSD